MAPSGPTNAGVRGHRVVDELFGLLANLSFLANIAEAIIVVDDLGEWLVRVVTEVQRTVSFIVAEAENIFRLCGERQRVLQDEGEGGKCK